MIRALHKLARFVAWIMSPDKLESDQAGPPGSLRSAATRRWLFARERLPEPPRAGQDRLAATGRGWRFFFAPEPLDAGPVRTPVGTPAGPPPTFLGRLLAREPLDHQANPQIARGSFLGQLLSRERLGAQTPPQRVRGAFLRGLLSREYLDTQAAPRNARRSFLGWLFSSEAIDSPKG